MCNEQTQKRCFVVMGFGTKTDLATGRQLDLNKSYQYLIKPVVEDQGLMCIRADEIPHSGSIDVRMYQELLTADVVIADISTANANAFYELGIRHALRPHTTIVISENKLKYPFDLNHVKITSYEHLGSAIGYEETLRFRDELGETLKVVLAEEQPDSPVYTYLTDLVPPSLREQTAQAAERIEAALDQGKEKMQQENDDRTVGDAVEDKTLALLTQQGEQALENKDYAQAKSLFEAATHLCQTATESNIVANDAYLIHRLALATYQAEKPNPVAALEEALTLLFRLDLNHTNDSETVVLAGFIEKRLYEYQQGDEHLANAILYYQRGYYLLNNRYNGINLAFLLNCRADSSLVKTQEERIADMVDASRTRQRVLVLCERDWHMMAEKDKLATAATTAADKELSRKQEAADEEQKFWILVNRAEAYYGLGEMDQYEKALTEARKIDHTPGMMESFNQQVAELSVLMKKQGHLLNPPWKEGGSTSENAYSLETSFRRD